MKKKNIIFIMTDEQRYDSMSCVGSTIAQTPNIDSIAEGGTCFENSYCASPVCVPSRVCFFTGQYVHRNMATSNAPECHIKPSQLSLVEILKQQGYTTALCGKNHTFSDEYMDKWFDVREEYFHFGKTHGTFTHKDREVVEYLKSRSFEGLLDDPVPFAEEEWINDRIAQDALSFLDQAKDNPFMLYYSFPDPHWPNLACEPYSSAIDPDKIMIEAGDINWDGHPFKHFVQSQVNGFDSYTDEELKRIVTTYYAQILSVDDAIGKLLDKLKDLGLDDNTIIVFCADHGNFAGRYRLVGKTGGFHDALVRIPTVMNFPDMQQVKQSRAQISNIDVMPTILEYLHINIPLEVQGKSLLSVLRGKENAHRSEIYAEVGNPRIPPEPVKWSEFQKFSARQMEEKGWQWFCDYVANGRSAMIKKGNWKYCYYVGDCEELYNLKSDPLEMNNLSGNPEFVEMKTALHNRLMDWLLTMPVVKNESCPADYGFDYF